MSAEAPQTLPAKPKAYSYIRFSTPRQGDGHSLERQTAKAGEYALEHGLELDTELNLKDLGVSGYRQKNARTGALGLFMRAVEDGRVSRNSYLLVENIDRLTRADIPEAMSLFLNIITAGIVVVTLTNRQAYSRDSLAKDPMTTVFIVVELIRANQESARKGGLIAAAREKKRQDLWNGVKKRYTRQGPSWLQWSNEGETFLVLEDRAAIIRAIFEKADEGWSHDRIARWLNIRGTPTWGRGKRRATHWRGSYIIKILKSAAVIGTFTPRRTEHDSLTGTRRDVPLDPVRNHYPAVVERELFERVRARTSSTAPRGRNAGRITASMFAGVIKCARCSGTVTRLSKGEYVYLVCSKAHAKGGCKYLAVPYGAVEQALTDNLDALIEDAPRGRDTEELELQIRGLDEHVSELGEEARALLDDWLETRSPTIRQEQRAKELAWTKATERLREARERLDRLAQPFVVQRLKALEEALKKRPLDVVQANQAIKAAIEKLVLDPEQGMLFLHWHDTDRVEAIPVRHARHVTVFDDVANGHSERATE
jgi:DNA invertase Pin-like site-specific DNA recombinase